MPVSSTRLLAMWREVLTLSKLEEGEGVLVLTSANSNPQLIDAATRAASELGAKVARVDLPRDVRPGEAGTDPTRGHRAVADRRQPDGARRDEGGRPGDRPGLPSLHAGAARGAAAPERGCCWPTTPPKSSRGSCPPWRPAPGTGGARRLRAGAGAPHVTSKAGTDLRATSATFPITAEYGFVDEPGRWDHWPSGFVARQSQRADRATARWCSPRATSSFPSSPTCSPPIRLTISAG